MLNWFGDTVMITETLAVMSKFSAMRVAKNTQVFTDIFKSQIAPLLADTKHKMRYEAAYMDDDCEVTEATLVICINGHCLIGKIHGQHAWDQQPHMSSVEIESVFPMTLDDEFDFFNN